LLAEGELPLQVRDLLFGFCDLLISFRDLRGLPGNFFAELLILVL
jgi:hypothetical protein